MSRFFKSVINNKKLLYGMGMSSLGFTPFIFETKK